MSQVFQNPYSNSVMWSLQGGLIQLVSDEGGVLESEDTTNYTNILAATERIEIRQQRRVDTRMPLVGNTSIKIVAAPTGQCTLSTIIGPHHVIDEFMNIFGNPCQPFTTYVYTTAKENQICKGDFQGQKLVMTGCTGQLTNFTLATQGNVAIAQGVFSFAFDTLDWSAANRQNT